MNEVIEAAKAVIARWDTPTWKNAPATGEYINRLRVAVARADKQEAVGFRGWWLEMMEGSPTATEDEVKGAWLTAQQVERERIKEMVRNMGKDDPWIHYLTLLEKIDAPTE